MRLQLIIFFLLSILACSAQDFSSTDSARKQRSIGPVDVDFLFSYYDQDGNHSPVTGGIGTEKLEDYATKIIVNIPLDSLNSLLFNVGFNYYSSASTDKIDRRVSSASSKDSHVQMETEYSRKNLKRHSSFSLGIAGSIESDYTSSSVSAGWQKESADLNRSFAMKASAYFDHWRLIIPSELRDSSSTWQYFKTDKRRTFSLAFTYSQTLTKRFQAAVILEGAYQYGLLATPFHRVYFKDEAVPKIETLPGYRIKFPVAVKANYFLGDFLILRFYYRFYIDNFGIISNTASLEIPVKIIPVISVSPFYRFYHQTESDYFREFAQHETGEEYFTSDYDLSAFFSHKVGVGLSYNPGAGIRKLTQAQKKIKFKNVGVRYANYFRSDGLRAFMASIGISFSF